MQKVYNCLVFITNGTLHSTPGSIFVFKYWNQVIFMTFGSVMDLEHPD